MNYPRQESNNTGESRENRESADKAAQNPAHFDRNLAVVVDAWPTLPEAIRIGILTMINATNRRSTSESPKS